jgi:hypothetical protein
MARINDKTNSLETEHLDFSGVLLKAGIFFFPILVVSYGSKAKYSKQARHNGISWISRLVTGIRSVPNYATLIELISECWTFEKENLSKGSE